MGNANTAHSRRLRAEKAQEWERKNREAGGWNLRLNLRPEAAAWLRAEMQRTGESAVAIVSRLLEQL